MVLESLTTIIENLNILINERKYQDAIDKATEALEEHPTSSVLYILRQVFYSYYLRIN